MNTAAALFVMLALMICRAAAADPTPPTAAAADPPPPPAAAADPTPAPVSNKALIASMPTADEMKKWRSWSPEQRQSPEGAHLLAIIKSFPANCQQLQSRLVMGKPLSDYPGLLTLGSFFWIEDAKKYRLIVKVGSRGYYGFECYFDQSCNIVGLSHLHRPEL